MTKQPDSPEPRFAVCVRNDGYPASLETRKIYRVLPDAECAADGLLRVIDESGEDYLFPASYFLVLEVSASIEEALLRAS